jgi:hypothetical protein
VRPVGESGSTTKAVPGAVFNEDVLVAPAPTVVNQLAASSPLPAAQPEGTTTGGSTDGGQPPHAGDGRGESAPRAAAAGHQLTSGGVSVSVGVVFAAVGDDGFGRLTGSGGPFPTSSPMTHPPEPGGGAVVLAPPVVLAPARGAALA